MPPLEGLLLLFLQLLAVRRAKMDAEATRKRPMRVFFIVRFLMKGLDVLLIAGIELAVRDHDAIRNIAYRAVLAQDAIECSLDEVFCRIDRCDRIISGSLLALEGRITGIRYIAAVYDIIDLGKGIVFGADGCIQGHGCGDIDGEENGVAIYRPHAAHLVIISV